jgi:predicted transcriptional regulator
MNRWTPERFRAALLELNLTPDGFAKVTGIAPRSVYYYLTGERSVPAWVPFMIRLMKLYHRDVMR